MKKVVLLTILLTLIGLNSKATHNNGGDITYRWVSANTYNIKMTLYVDCSSVMPDTIAYNSFSSSCGINRFDTLYLSLREDVSQVCDTMLLSCNGGSISGQTKWVYEATVSGYTPCNDWRLSYSLCCRSTGPLNVNASVANFYIETTFDNTIQPNNSSPYFADNPRWYAPVNGANLINAGAYDAEGDSLHYSLVAPRSANGTPIAYNIGYSINQPFGGMSTSIDSKTGIISTLAPNVGQFIISVRLDEFRNGQLLSSVYRDFATNVYVNANALPQITNSSLGINNLCTIDTLKLDIYSQDATDTITTSILYPFSPTTIVNPGGGPFFSNTSAPLNSNKDHLTDTNTLQWILLGLLKDKEYTIYINVEDEVCPIKNVQSYAVVVSTSYCVWPGDADNDLIADIFDVLPIGVYYGNTGTARAGATLNWEGQWSQNWGPKQVSGDDIKHADCNGDGVIDGNDTTAILLNYNLTHAKSGGIGLAGANDPDLYVDIIPDTVGTSAPLSIPIKLGTPSVPADSVYGIVLRMSYDPKKIDSLAGVTVDYSNSWLGTEGVDMITLDTNFYDNGQIDVGLVRTDGQMISNAFGEVLTLNVITIDNLSGKSANYGSLIFDFIDAKIIDINEADRPFNQLIDSVVIKDITTGITIAENNHMVIAPNPTSGKFSISANHSIENVQIYNTLGQAIDFVSNNNGKQRIIDLTQNEKGIYMVKVVYEDNSFTIRKMIVH